MNKISMNQRWAIYALLAAVALILSVSIYQYIGRSEDTGTHKSAAPVIEYYTCPMHPQIHAEGPGECPICHMRLVPVYKKLPEKAGHLDRGDGDTHTDHDEPAGLGAADPNGSGVDASFEIDREGLALIGIGTARAQRRDIASALNTTGRVAFDPELSIAIREYLSVYRSDPELRRASENRLRLLGMGDSEIRSLPANRRAYDGLYLPVRSGTVWVYATIYEHELPLVKAGQSARVVPSYSGGESYTGRIRSLSPTVDPQSRSVTARIEVRGGGGKLLPDSFVNVEIQVGLGRALSIPQSAVLDSGREQSVFVVRDKTRFTRRRVRTGIASGEWIAVLEGLSEGEEVVSSAAFMIDSESRLRTVGQTPEGHTH
jgi:Cu(I)/Ag(I) efflux system membrane fusion protein